MSSTVGVATINGALRDQGFFQSIDGSIWVFGCSLARALGVILASIFAGIENDLVQAVSLVPVFMKSFASVDYVASLTPKATFGAKLKVLRGPKVAYTSLMN